MDAITEAAQNVSILLNRKLEIPPVPVKSIRKQADTNVTQNESPIGNTVQPMNIVKVYEVWQVFLEDNEEELEYVFIVVSGDYTLQGYANGEWSNIEYRGFYTTLEEAQNEISGYLR
jgi:hypothetical protein